jgi:hypothetical protein
MGRGNGRTRPTAQGRTGPHRAAQGRTGPHRAAPAAGSALGSVPSGPPVGKLGTPPRRRQASPGRHHAAAAVDNPPAGITSYPAQASPIHATRPPCRRAALPHGVRGTLVTGDERQRRRGAAARAGRDLHHGLAHPRRAAPRQRLAAPGLPGAADDARTGALHAGRRDGGGLPAGRRARAGAREWRHAPVHGGGHREHRAPARHDRPRDGGGRPAHRAARGRVRGLPDLHPLRADAAGALALPHDAGDRDRRRVARRPVRGGDPLHRAGDVRHVHRLRSEPLVERWRAGAAGCRAGTHPAALQAFRTLFRPDPAR